MAEIESGTRRALTFEDWWKLKAVTEAQLSPDGRTVAFVVAAPDEKSDAMPSAIWLADVESGDSRQFTSGEGTDTSPRWSPDGQEIAFVSKRHEAKPQVFVIPAGGGEPRRLTTAQDGAHTPIWAPDGKRIAFISDCVSKRQRVPLEESWLEEHGKSEDEAPRMRRQTELLSRFDGAGYTERRSHLFLLDLADADAEPQQCTEGDYNVYTPAWSPDGRSIAFQAKQRDDAEYHFAFDVWTLDVEGGEQRRLTDGTLGFILPLPLSWSPDSDTIALYTAPEAGANEYHDFHLYTVPAAGGPVRDLSRRLDQTCGMGVLPDYVWPPAIAPAWSPDGGTVYFIAVDHGDQAVFAVDREGGPVRRISTAGSYVTGVQSSPDGQTLVGVASHPSQPFEVCALPSRGGALRSITHLNDGLLAGADLAPAKWLTCHAPDGRAVESLLIMPPATGSPVPLIVRIHGGPHAAWGNVFYFLAQAFAGAGYATLYVNPRGSQGYGQEFARLADWGDDDFGDILAAVDAVLAQESIAEDAIGITGGSYGGFMTNWALGHTDRFAAGVAINGIANLTSFYGTGDISALWYAHGFPRQFGGPFWRDRQEWDRYIHHSPIAYVENITAPLLLLHSENDYRCPIEQSEQMLTALRVLRRTVELVRIPNASHALIPTPHQRYLQYVLTKQWFDSYLRPGTPGRPQGDSR